jgi:trk system potassium uptake protein TrkH
MHLFRAEVPGPLSERLSPRITQTAKFLWYVYAGLTLALTLLLMAGGLSAFDAVNHAFTAMPTGGFSTKNASIAAYSSPFVQYVLILFMYLAGVNFVLHFRALSGRVRGYWASPEWRFYTAAILMGATAVFFFVFFSESGQGLGIERVFRDSLFQVVSVGTTTGFVTANYGNWPLAAQLILLALMMMGGMAGSTGGGIKSMRMYVLLRAGITELRKNLHPRAVVVTPMGSKALQDSELLNILGFVLLFVGLTCAGILILAGLGHDLETSIGASVASIANIGPGLGDVGAVENFGWMDPASHLVLVGLMLVGRLEIFTVLLLFYPDLWRR